MKTCIKCGCEKPATDEYFPKDKAMKDGFKSSCKVCKREYNKQYKAENKAQMIEYSKKNYQKNKEKIAIYKQANKSRIDEYRKQHYIENKEKIAMYSNKYRKLNQEKIVEYRKENRERNKPLNLRHEQRRRALKLQLPATLTIEEWEMSLNHFNNQCCYCGVNTDKFHQDHFIPLSKNGGYVKENIVPSCPTCNHSKHNSDFEHWYRKQAFYNEQRELKILEFISQQEIKEMEVN